MTTSSTRALSSLRGSCRSAGWAGAMLLTMTWAAGPVMANEPSVPWECSGYTGDAHARCLQAYIETQQEKISRLEGELRLQQSSVDELRDRVDRQRAATADLERQLSDRSYADRLYAPPPVPFYSYSYPPLAWASISAVLGIMDLRFCRGRILGQGSILGLAFMVRDISVVAAAVDTAAVRLDAVAARRTAEFPPTRR